MAFFLISWPRFVFDLAGIVFGNLMMGRPLGWVDICEFYVISVFFFPFSHFVFGFFFFPLPPFYLCLYNFVPHWWRIFVIPTCLATFNLSWRYFVAPPALLNATYLYLFLVDVRNLPGKVSLFAELCIRRRLSCLPVAKEEGFQTVPLYIPVYACLFT